MVTVLMLTVPVAAAPQILEVYPDPHAPGDAGEWVIISSEGHSGLRVSDGEASTRLPIADRVILSNSPEQIDPPVNGTHLYTSIQLANSGETVRLLDGDSVLDTMEYERAREGIRYHHQHGEVSVGVTPRSTSHHTVAQLRPLVYPGAAGQLEELVAQATERIIIGCYTFASPSLTDRLLDRLAAGVTVQLLCERTPIGGMSHRQVALLDRLTAAGGDVRLIGGPTGRYRYHHPKYLVVDDHAAVLTENFKPAGTGGRDSRGWGVLVRDGAFARSLAAIHAHDAAGSDVRRFDAIRSTLTVTDAPIADGRYPREAATAAHTDVPVSLATAPTSADPLLLSTLTTAETSIRVITPRLPADGRHFQALIGRAHDGVQVQVLLSNAWYDASENAATVAAAEQLNASGVPIRVRIATPAGRFGKVHAKGAVIDGRQLLVGSVNWNDGAPTRNREVLMRVDDRAVAGDFAAVFDADWQTSSTVGGPLTTMQHWQLGGAAAAAAGLAFWRVRRAVRFT